MPGTMPPRAQVPQEMVLPMVSLARLTARGLAAMAVMNMAEVTQVHWKHVFMMYEPSLSWVPFSGSEPQAMQRALARGKVMPPARAAREGMPGDRRASANTSE